MALVTSAQSGNWEDGTTWVGGVVPVSTDEVVINPVHQVSIFSNFEHTGVLHQKGTLIIKDGARTVIGIEGSRTYGTIYLYGGSTTKSEGTGSLVFVGGTFATKETTAENRAKWSCHMAPKLPVQLYAQQHIEATYCDFYGDSTVQTNGMSLVFYWSTKAVAGNFDYTHSSFIVKNCTFTDLIGTYANGEKVSNLGGIALGYPGYTGSGRFDVTIENCDFRNCERFYATAFASAESVWSFKENTVDATLIQLNNASSSTVSYKNNAYVDSSLSSVGSDWGSSSTSANAVFDKNVSIVTDKVALRSGSNGNGELKMQNGIVFFTETTTNPHILGTTADIIDGYILEEYSLPISGNLPEANHIIGTHTVLNTISIGSGDMFNFVGHYENNAYNWKNNTFAITLDGGIGSMVLAENSTFNNNAINITNNLLYRTGNSTEWGFCRWVGGTPPTPLAINLTNNACSFSMPWHTDQYTNTDPNPDSNIVVDPKVLDATRGLRTATQYLGYTDSTAGNAITEPWLRSNGYAIVDGIPTQDVESATKLLPRVQDVVEWIREGHTPQNMALATAGEGGTYVGAVMPQEASKPIFFNGASLSRIIFNGQEIPTQNIAFKG